MRRLVAVVTASAATRFFIGLGALSGAFWAPAGASPTVPPDVTIATSPPNVPGAPTEPSAAPPAEFCDGLRQLIQGLEGGGAPAELTGALREINNTAGCPPVPPPGSGGGADPLAPAKEVVCPVLDDLIDGARGTPVPGDVIGGLEAVRDDVVGCPRAPTPTTTTTAPTTTTTKPAAPSGGGSDVRGTSVGAGSSVPGGALPRTGGGSVAGLALGFGAIAALGRRFLER